MRRHLRAQGGQPRAPHKFEHLWLTDSDHKAEHQSWIGKKVQKNLPGHGTFNGTISEYHYPSDHYTILYEDNDIERLPYTGMKSLVPGAQLSKKRSKSTKNCRT